MQITANNQDCKTYRKYMHLCINHTL